MKWLIFNVKRYLSNCKLGEYSWFINHHLGSIIRSEIYRPKNKCKVCANKAGNFCLDTLNPNRLISICTVDTFDFWLNLLFLDIPTATGFQLIKVQKISLIGCAKFPDFWLAVWFCKSNQLGLILHTFQEFKYRLIFRLTIRGGKALI